MFKKPSTTVASVVTAFAKMLDDLKTVEASSEAAAVKAAEEIEQARAAQSAALEEAAAARAVAAKINAIITAGNMNAAMDDLREETKGAAYCRLKTKNSILARFCRVTRPLELPVSTSAPSISIAQLGRTSSLATSRLA